MRSLIIVDDEPLTITYLKNNIPEISSDWHVAGIFRDGIEACEWLENNTVDVVITDVKMPGMTGLELCEKIVEMNPEQYIVIISGYDEFEFAQEAISYGVRGYILKPLNKEKIRAIIEKASKQFDILDKQHGSEVHKTPDSVVENNLVMRAKEYIHQNYRIQISLADVAQELNVSANYLSSLFSKETGQSYINYLTNFRITRAEEIMKNSPHKKIYEVAKDVGYVSVKHFLYVFKKERGVSPGEYQKRVISR